MVMEAGAIGEGGEVFVLDMGDPIKILDLAKEMIKFSGFEPDKNIPIVFTEPRPGEKFFEDILAAEEGTEITPYQKVFKAKLSMSNIDRLDLKLERLNKLLEQGDKKLIIKLLKEIAPSYQPRETNFKIS